MMASKEEALAATVSRLCVGRVCDQLTGMLDATPIDRFGDRRMRGLASLWQSATPEVRVQLAGLVLLGAQNALASLFSSLDEDLRGDALAGFTLAAENPAGGLDPVGRDLVDAFWAEEERAGRVNAP